MSDRELLELAAKAIGYVAYFNKADACQLTTEGTSEGYVRFWNPLEDDGDAMRLAVKLMMSVEISDHEQSTYAYAGSVPRVYACEMWKDDINAATRRAIVRAAAEIGRSTK